MARTINILSESLANKIAAGEVVQRPASVVKELIENSIDAHSSSITVVIKDGGKTLIQLIDDGDGMNSEDATIAFQRHATSKIVTYEDLENIRTLGFRGEALASIAAVSHVEMRTRPASSEVGTKVRIEGGTVVEESKEATAPGTLISVRNLFYNTPGRRNFLKSDNTEYKHIFDVVQRLAISHPELSIKFTSDDETILDLRPASVQDRIRELFGEKLAQSLITFEEENDLLKLTGFLSKPEFARKGRTEQHLFLNKRYIINRNINHAVFQGYEHLLEKGSFPVFVLMLTIDPIKVDVNVHPSKMEVKFEDEGAIYRIIVSAVRKTLSTHDLFPIAEIKDSVSSGVKVGMQFSSPSSAASRSESNWKELIRPTTLIHKPSTPISSAQEQIETKSSSIGDVPLWQLHNKYIIVPIESGVMIVDQHAAHERVLYERAIARFNGGKHNSQQLLFPHTIQMTAGDSALLKQLLALLENLGFSLRLFSNTTVILDGVPTDVKAGEESTILQDILDLYKEDEQTIKLEPRERLAKSFSCRAAIKAGDPLKENEMRTLLDQLNAAEIPSVCPHGRPVMIKLSLSELDKRFGRTS